MRRCRIFFVNYVAGLVARLKHKPKKKKEKYIFAAFAVAGVVHLHLRFIY